MSIVLIEMVLWLAEMPKSPKIDRVVLKVSEHSYDAALKELAEGEQSLRKLQDDQLRMMGWM